MFKKILAAMLYAVLLLTLFAGCSGGTTGSSSTSTPESSAESSKTSSTAEAGDPGEAEGDRGEPEQTGDLAFKKFDDIVEVHIGQSVSATETLPAGKSVDNNQYTDYLMENCNIDIAVDWTAASGDDYNQRVSLCIASNTLPDGMTVSRQYMITAAKSNQLFDLTDLYQAYASDQVKTVMDSTNGRAYEDVTFDSKQMAIPAVEVECGGIQMLTVRQDWLDQYGLETPKTLADVEAIAEVFKNEKPAGDSTIPIAGPDKNGDVYSSFLSGGTTTCGFDQVFTANNAYPGFWVEENSEITYGSLSQNARNALELLADWYAKGYIDPEMGTRDSSIEMINAGNTGMYFAAWWVPGYGTGDAYRNNPDANWQSYPIFDANGTWNTKVGPATTGYTIISKNATEDKAAAMITMENALLRDESLFDVSDEPLSYWPVRTLMAPADESEVTYHELIKVLDGNAEPEDYAGTPSAYKLLASNVSVVRETVPGYVSGQQLSIGDFSMENFGNFQRMYSLLIGDRPYSTTENVNKVYSLAYSPTETLESRWSNLQAMEEEVMLMIITGKSDISAFDDFVQRWRNEGGDKIIEEIKDLVS